VAYSDFDLSKATDLLGIQLVSVKDLYAHVPDGIASDYLRTVLEFPSAFSTNSEIARREMIIAPILNSVFSIQPARFVIFSAENFDVDKQLSLNGLADYLVCISTSPYLIQSPVIVIAESKKNDPAEGLGQCIAELHAAALFNERKKHPLERIFGITTNGYEWLLGEYVITDKIFYHDSERYALRDLPRILGILSYMRDEALRMYDSAKNA
jgi:hypothetical protein